MVDPKLRHKQAEEFFEGLWQRGDPWEFETSDFEQQKYEEEIRVISDRRYENVLEIGCGAGAFTRRLAAHASRVLALDVSPTAIARAGDGSKHLGNTEFRVQNAMEFNIRSEGPWDLIVLNETIYYLGWLYTFFEVAWFASESFHAMRGDGRLLMANTYGEGDDYLIMPSVIHTYRDLFKNSGYDALTEEVFSGIKHDVRLEVLMSVLTKPADPR